MNNFQHLVLTLPGNNPEDLFSEMYPHPLFAVASGALLKIFSFLDNNAGYVIQAINAPMSKITQIVTMLNKIM